MSDAARYHGLLIFVPGWFYHVPLRLSTVRTLSFQKETPSHVKPVKTFFVAALCALSLAAPTLVLADAVSDSNSNPSTTNSQQGATPGSYHHHGMGAMLKTLNLTQQQQEQIKTLISTYRQAHPEGSQPDPAAKEQLHQQILNVLTPEQRTKLEQEKAQWKQHRMEQGTAPTPAPK